MSSPDQTIPLAEAIANERENFRQLFRQTPEMVCILRGPEHVFEFVNEAHIRALGFDATGQAVRVAQPESVEVHGLLDKVYRTGETADLHEIPVTLADRVRYFNLTYSASRDSQGNVNGVMVLGTEVTEQYLSRELLKTQNFALEMTLNGSPLEKVLSILAKAMEFQLGREIKASILILSADGKYLRHGAAPSMPEEYNRLIDGLPIGPRSGSCGTAAYAEKEINVVEIASDPLWADFRDLAKNFGLRSCRSIPIRSSRGSLMGTFAVYNQPLPVWNSDQQIINLITRTTALILERSLEERAKQEAEAALKESDRLLRLSEERLGLAIEVAKVGFYDWNIPEDHIVFSRQMMADWGLREGSLRKLEDAVGRIHPDDRQRVSGLIQDTMVNDSPYATHYRVVRPDGETVWLDVRGQVHRDANGTPLRFFGTSVAITEQKEKEIALKRAQAAAEAANRAKGLFLANMSHEIRTPLGAIMGFLELLKNPNHKVDDLDRFIGVIDRNSKHLFRLVDDILDLSKIEAGKIVLESLTFSLTELLADFTAMMSFRAQENGLKFSLDLESSLPRFVVGDPTRLRQVLNNVVGNAIKFTRRGEVRVKASFVDDLFTVTVKDTGVGISPDAAEKLFEPFSQGDDSTTRLFGGTGLGLVLTRRLTEAMGGDFSLQASEVERGSTFVARVKLTVGKSPVNAQAPAPHPTTEQPLAGLRVLVADDSTDNQNLIEFFLTEWGATSILANDGREAIQLAKEFPVDVILMDVQMPNVDGHDATRTLRADGFARPIIALTAHAMNEEKARCLESGFSVFLSKPIHRPTLLAALVDARKQLN